MWRISLSGLLLALSCSGCSVWTSETPDQLQQDDRAPRGVHYALPKGVVTVKLTVVQATANYNLLIEGPTFVPDLEHKYFLRYRQHPSYSDDVRVTTNKDGLLQRVAASTTDQTPGIIVNLVKAAVGGGKPVDAVPVYPLDKEGAETGIVDLLTVTIDPLDHEQVRQTEREIDAAVVGFRDRMRTACGFYAQTNGGGPAQQSRTYLEGQLLNATASKPLLEANKTRATTKVTTTQAALIAVRPDGGRVDCGEGKSPPVATKGAIKVTPTARPATQPTPANPFPGQAEVGNQPGDPNAIQAAVKAYCAAVKDLGQATAEIERVDRSTASLKSQIDAIDTAKKAQDDLCPAYVEMNAPPKSRINVRDFGDAQAPAPRVAGWKATVADQKPKADCTAGLCYRPKEPYRIEYSLGRGKDTLLAELPNSADLVAIDLRRAFLIQKLQDIHFDTNGFLTSLKIQKGSELLAASEIPINILMGISEGLAARATITTKLKDLTDAETALAKAHADQLPAAPPAATKKAVESGGVSETRPRRGASSGGAVR